MKRTVQLLLACSLILFGVHQSCAQVTTPWRLWYDRPAGNTWEHALPIGNGRVGAMVFGNVVRETLQLNEHTVWSGSPNRNDNPAARSSLAEIRQLILEGKQKDAEKLANENIITKVSNGQMFQPVGNLHLSFDHANYSDYLRELDIEKAVAKVSYRVNEVTYTREMLTSLPDGVLVVHLAASKQRSISFAMSCSTPQPRASIRVSKNEISVTGTTVDHEGVAGKIRFKGVARIKLHGGKLAGNDTSVVVSGADAATIYVAIATNFNNYNDISGNESERVDKLLDKAFVQSFQEVKNSHIQAYQKLFSRVTLDLGAAPATDLPTDQRLRNFNTVADPQFAALYFQFGRYLLISSSRPGGQPATLQGIWNDKMQPPWDSKYTININAEMNYWPAERTNLSELHEPFLRMVTELSVTGRETARVMYGAKGWMAHHNTDLWRTTGAVDGAFWGSWSGGGAWTSQHLWEHYLYTGDQSYLSAVYPALRDVARFYVDFLVEHPVYHWLVVNPDTSPENAPKAHQGSSIDVGTTMTNQLVFDTFTNAIRAAEVLNRDQSFADTLKRMRSRLPPMHIGQHAQLQEWLDDVDDPNDHHRHVSHLYGLFPSNQISPYRTPQLYTAARNTLMQRGDVSTGWSMGWKVNWWARLLDGNHAYKLIQNQLTPVGTNADGGGTYDNLFDAHPPFQIDGNFGCTSGIAEMLIQCGDDAVHLLPALPDVWPNGRVTGLRAKGGFEIVEMNWKDAQVTKVVIRSNLGGNLRLRSYQKLRGSEGFVLASANGKNPNPLYQIEENVLPVISARATVEAPVLRPVWLYDLPSKRGEILTLIPEQ